MSLKYKIPKWLGHGQSDLWFLFIFSLNTQYWLNDFVVHTYKRDTGRRIWNISMDIGFFCYSFRNFVKKNGVNTRKSCLMWIYLPNSYYVYNIGFLLVFENDAENFFFLFSINSILLWGVLNCEINIFIFLFLLEVEIFMCLE